MRALHAFPCSRAKLPHGVSYISLLRALFLPRAPHLYRNEAFFFRLQVRRPGGRPGGGRALGERQVREKGGGYSKVWRMRGRGRVAR